MSKTLITDLYQLTMAASYHDNAKTGSSTFDLFIRKLPDNWGYFIAAGLEDAVDYLLNLKFDKEDIDYLRSTGQFKEDFLEYLKDFKFTGSLSAVPEGTVVFPNEPILRITAPKIEAQFVETYLLNLINHQTMIATKASRVVHSADGAPVVDFGLRRAQGESAGIKGARAAYIGGCVGTSNVEAGRLYDIPVKGTHAHSFVMSFENEVDAFRAYVKTFPDNAILLIDTYDVMGGAKNAMIVAKELEQKGHKLLGVRLDSGDLLTQSKKVRGLFNLNGLEYLKIFASNDLNEHKIEDLVAKGARIDAYGVGTELITSKDCPALSGVYKLAEDTSDDGNLVAKIKLSEGKKTLPGRKQIYRSLVEGVYSQDIIGLEGEFSGADKLLENIIENGVLVYKIPSLAEVRMHAKDEMKKLHPFVRSLKDPSKYSVVLSPKVEELSEKLTQKYSEKFGGRVERVQLTSS